MLSYRKKNTFSPKKLGCWIWLRRDTHTEWLGWIILIRQSDFTKELSPKAWKAGSYPNPGRHSSLIGSGKPSEEFNKYSLKLKERSSVLGGWKIPLDWITTLSAILRCEECVPYDNLINYLWLWINFTNEVIYNSISIYLLMILTTKANSLEHIHRPKNIQL